MTTLKRFACFSIFLLLVLQGCSTPNYRRPPPPVVDKGTTAPVIVDSPAPAPAPDPVPPPRVQVVPPRDPFQAPSATRQPAAVVALLETADQQASDGDHGAAAASLERAIRISPSNPVLWYRLAGVRLEQGEAIQAEQLAVKSNSLAAGDSVQQARNWHLIAAARHLRSDSTGASAAERKARELERR